MTEIKCHYCTKEYSTRQARDKHVRLKHPEEREAKNAHCRHCNVCPYQLGCTCDGSKVGISCKHQHAVQIYGKDVSEVVRALNSIGCNSAGRDETEENDKNELQQDRELDGEIEVREGVQNEMANEEGQDSKKEAMQLYEEFHKELRIWSGKILSNVKTGDTETVKRAIEMVKQQNVECTVPVTRRLPLVGRPKNALPISQMSLRTAALPVGGFLKVTKRTQEKKKTETGPRFEEVPQHEQSICVAMDCWNTDPDTVIDSEIPEEDWPNVKWVRCGECGNIYHWECRKTGSDCDHCSGKIGEWFD